MGYCTRLLVLNTRIKSTTDGSSKVMPKTRWALFNNCLTHLCCLELKSIVLLWPSFIIKLMWCKELCNA